MADIILSDLGAQALLNRSLGIFPTIKGFTFHLFVNDVAVTDADTVSAFVEATGGEYAALYAAETSFTTSIVGGIAQMAGPQQFFQFTGALETNTDIYGYYVLDGDGVLIYSQKAAVVYTPGTAGDAYKFVPVFKLSKGTPT